MIKFDVTNELMCIAKGSGRFCNADRARAKWG